MTNQLCRIAGINAGGVNALGDHAAGANDDIIADVDWQNGRVGANAYIVPDPGAAPERLVTPRGTTRDKEVIYEHDPMADETIISNLDEFANEGVGLDLGS